jgi:hypothetical protein
VYRGILEQTLITTGNINVTLKEMDNMQFSGLIASPEKKASDGSA